MLNFNKKNYYLIALLCGTVLLAGFLYINHKNQQKQKQEQRIAAELEARERADLDALFDIYLNDFKADLKKHATAYKGSRRVLNEIISPYNFETTEYAKENYYFFKDYIAPDLRNKSAEIINLFQQYTVKLKNDLKNKNSAIEKKFLLKWQDMGKAQLEKYIDFFTKEEQLIQAYENAIEFYYTHSKRFSLDLENNKLMFDNENDKEKEAALLNKIRDIRGR